VSVSGGFQLRREPSAEALQGLCGGQGSGAPSGLPFTSASAAEAGPGRRRLFLLGEIMLQSLHVRRGEQEWFMLECHLPWVILKKKKEKKKKERNPNFS